MQDLTIRPAEALPIRPLPPSLSQQRLQRRAHSPGVAARVDNKGGFNAPAPGPNCEGRAVPALPLRGSQPLESRIGQRYCQSLRRCILAFVGRNSIYCGHLWDNVGESGAPSLVRRPIC